MIIVGAECRSSSNSERVAGVGRGRGAGTGGGWVCARECAGGGGGGGRVALRPRPLSRIIVLAPWMSGGSALGAVVWLESREKSLASSGIARIETEVGLGWNGTSG